MQVLESTEKMDLGLQSRAAIVAAASKRCFSSAVKQPVDGLLLSNSLNAAATGLACMPANKYAPFGMIVTTFCPGHARTAPLDTLAKSFSKRSNVKPEEVPAGRTREIPACPASQRASYLNRTFLAVDGRLVRSPSSS
jgi:3-oxoacyl-[acyl-carrier protein] reductase